jgi:hypothetical protein
MGFYLSLSKGMKHTLLQIIGNLTQLQKKAPCKNKGLSQLTPVNMPFAYITG